MLPPESHPPVETLIRFARGECDDETLTHIESHLESCEPCCDQLTTVVEEDEFEQGLRVAAQETASMGPPRLSRSSDDGRTSSLPTIPGFEIERELGRGGMGIVYLARHLALNRPVAIKRLRDGALATPDDLRRFRAEALALGRLHHPHIVQVYESGTVEGCPFVVLEHVSGGTLAEFTCNKPMSPREAARIVIALAEGIQVAHSAGIIHRDLKPANILIAQPGDRPKISDFGLSKLIDDGGFASVSGSIAGTPNYMAPEQALGGVTGPAVDVYALGGILYELLSGRPPFIGATLLETLRQVREQEPIPPSRMRRVPRDLETICLKCLHKQPRSRYTSAAALAEDLQRFLDGRPIKARPVSSAVRVLKWMRRYPGYSALIAGFVAALIAGFTGIMVQYRKAEQARQVAVSEQQRTQNLAAEQSLDRGLMLCENGQVELGLSFIRKANEFSSRTDELLDFTIQANLQAWQEQVLPAYRTPSFGTAVTCVAFAPDSRRFLTGDWGNRMSVATPGLAQVWEIDDLSKPLLTVESPCSITSVVYHPEGNVFLTGGLDGLIRIWDASTGKPIAEPLRLGGMIRAIAFNPAGTRLAAVSTIRDAHQKPIGGYVGFWSWPDRQPTSEPKRLPIAFSCLDWRPGSDVVAAGGAVELERGRYFQGEIRHFDARSGREVGPVIKHSDAFLSMAFFRNGLLIAGSLDGVARGWTPTGQRMGTMPAGQDAVNSIRFAPNTETMILVGSTANPATLYDGTGEVQLWDLRTSRRIGPSFGEKREGLSNVIHAAVPSPDGKWIACVSENGLAWLNPLRDVVQSLAKASFREFAVPQFSPDGSLLIAWVAAKREEGFENKPGEFHVLDARTFESRSIIKTKTEKHGSISPDSRRLLAAPRAASDPHLAIWELPTGEPVQLPEALQRPIKWVEWIANGTQIAVIDSAEQFQRYDATTFAPIGEPLPAHTARAVETSGRALLLLGPEPLVLFAPDGRTTALRSEVLTCDSAAFVESGEVLVTGQRNPGTIRAWNTRTGAPLTEPINLNEPIEVLAARDEQSILLQRGVDGHPKPYRKLKGRTLQSVSLEFSANAVIDQHPSGLYVASAPGAISHQVQLVALNGKRLGLPVPHPGRVFWLRFSPDGRFLATSGDDRTVRLWPVPSGLQP